MQMAKNKNGPLYYNYAAAVAVRDWIQWSELNSRLPMFQATLTSRLSVFGPAPALYLREVEEIYQSQAVGSWSPRDADVRHHFSQAELDRVPETVLRFVTYRGANFDAGRI